LYNEDILQKTIQLEEDIKTSVEKFYRKWVLNDNPWLYNLLYL
jgi:hypothetical protein